MAVNKNFVVKNGLEVNSDLIFADSSSNKVGIASTVPRTALDVRGGIAATDINITGILTAASLDIADFGVLNGSGANITGFSTLGGVSVDQLTVTGFTTFADLSLDEISGRNISLTGIATIPVFVGLTSFNDGIEVTGISTFNEIDTTNLNVTGVTTFTGAIDANGNLDVDGTTELDVLNVAETATFSANIDANGDLDVDGRTELDITNISETLNVTGISTFASNVDLNADLDVDGHTELDNLNVSGVSTIATVDINAGDIEVSNVDTTDLNVTGVGTITNARVTNLNVSGVSTIPTLAGYPNFTGGVTVSGVVTATQFFGAGQIGIGTSLGVVGYGVSFLEFRGPGFSSAQYNASVGIVTLSFEGGGTSGGGGGGTGDFTGIVTARAGLQVLANGIDVTGIGTFEDRLTYDGSLGQEGGGTVTLPVKVASKNSTHRYNGSGSSNGYVIDNLQAPVITLTPGRTYRFDQSDSSNDGHPLRFYYQAGKTTEYTTNVTTSGTPGSDGYTDIEITDTTPLVLHYQCSSHSLMGNSVFAQSNPIVGAGITLNADGGGVHVTGIITATSFSGNATSATTATTATNVTVADESSDTTCFPLFVTAATGDLGPKSGTNLTFNSSSGALTATSFVGALTGNATGLSGTPNISCGTGAFSGNVTLQANLDLQDNDKILVGTGDDLEIYHDGSDTFLTHVGTGFVYLQNTTNDADVVIRSDDGSGGLANYVVCDGSSGKVLLYHYGTLKANTKSDGFNVDGELECNSLDVDGAADITGTVTLHGNLDLQDNDQILIGSGDDLAIEHTGSGSFIRTSTSATGDLAIEARNGGDLYLTAADDIFIRPQAGEAGIVVTGNGAVELYYDNSKKLETKSDGIDVTGEVQCDSLDVDGTTHATGDITAQDSTNFFSQLGNQGRIILKGGESSNFLEGYQSNGTQTVTITNDGNATFGSSGAGTITATTFSGNATTATTATNVTVADESSDTTCFVLFSTAATGNLPPKSGSNLVFNSSNGTLEATDFNSTSDINLKKDIEVISSATEILKQIRGVKFTWKETDKKSTGVIAQEVEKVLPELVSERDDNGNKSVNYNGLVGALIEAVKELSARVEELENK